MKTLKNIFLSFLLILFSVFSFAQILVKEPATVTLVSSKNIHEANELVVDLDGHIITEIWSRDDIVRIEMEIKANEVTRNVIKHLVRKNRFHVKMEKLEDGSVFLSMPKLEQEIYINGRRLSEDISYRLLVPENVIVKIKT